MRWRHLLMHRPGNGRWKQFFFDRMRMIDWEDETGWRGRRNWAIISRDLISSRRADTKLLLTPVFAAVGVSCCGYRVHWSVSSCVVSRISSIGRFYFWKQLFHYHDREKCVGRIDNNKTFVFFFNMRKIIQLFFFGVDEKVKFRSESFFFIFIFSSSPLVRVPWTTSSRKSFLFFGCCLPLSTLYSPWSHWTWCMSNFHAIVTSSSAVCRPIIRMSVRVFLFFFIICRAYLCNALIPFNKTSNFLTLSGVLCASTNEPKFSYLSDYHRLMPSLLFF